MSDEENQEPTPLPFAERVWRTLSNIDVDQQTKEKGRFSYLPWANAWQELMNAFPESSFEFDPPFFFENGTGGEQWVTVTVKEGENEITRRWWLPFLDHSNKPIATPTALQINNTRMRVLTKCIAMHGLGVHVYSGEDVPEKEHDSKPVQGAKRTGVRAGLLEDIQVDEIECDKYVVRLREVMPDKDNVDFVGTTKLAVELMTAGDIAIAVADRLEAWQRTEMRKCVQAHKDAAREVAAEQVSGEQG